MFAHKPSNVTVVGQGYVGSVAAVALAEAGHRVLGVDIDRHKVEALRSGRIPIHEPGLQELLTKGLETGRLRLCHREDIDEVAEGVVLICVGTPSLPSGAADLSQVRSALRWVVSCARGCTILAMKSTVAPGTGRRLIAEELTHSGQIRYVSNPEFLREGLAVHDWFHPDRIVIGSEDEDARDRVKALYSGIDAPVLVTDTTSAEMIKYAANAFLATKISFINEIANLSDRLGATIDEVIKGISLDPRIGSSFLRAGLGYGGSCFPKDIRALDFFSTANGHDFQLLRSVITVNNRQRLLPLRVLRQVFGSLQNIPVTVLGLAFKPGTGDMRESPALDIIDLLLDDGADVRATDPMVDASASGVLPEGLAFFRDPMDALQHASAAVLVSEWPDYTDLDWGHVSRIMRKPRLIFDGRNALDQNLLESLGFSYRGIGRGAFANTTTNLN